MTRCHLHPTEAEARKTLAAIDAARGPTEELWDVVRTLRRPLTAEEDADRFVAGLSVAVRGGVTLLYRARTAPTKPWQLDPLVVGGQFGTIWDDRLAAHDGRAVTLAGGQTRTVPRAVDAVPVERDRAAEDLERTRLASDPEADPEAADAVRIFRVVDTKETRVR